MCTTRQAVVTDLLHPDSASHHCERTTEKVVALCRPELEYIREYGTCPAWFHELWLDIFEEWSLDTADIEGNNNVVKRHIKISSGIGWKLLSRRLISRNRINSLPDGRLAFNEFIAACVQHHPQTMAAMTPAAERELFNVVGDDDAPDLPGDLEAEAEAEADATDYYPAAPPPPPKPTASPDQHTAASYIVQVIAELTELGFADTKTVGAKQRFGLKASTQFCLRIHSSDNEQTRCDPFMNTGEYWFISKVFRKQAWCLRAAYDDSYGEPAVRAIAPYELYPLLRCFEHAIQDVGRRDLDVLCDIVTLRQDFRLYGTSSVMTEITPVLLTQAVAHRVRAPAGGVRAAPAAPALVPDAVEAAVVDAYLDEDSECSALVGEDRDIGHASDDDDEDCTSTLPFDD